MKTNLYPYYDECGVHLKDYGLLITPEAESITIKVEGVPYQNVYSFDKTNYPDKEHVSRKVFINTENVNEITLEICEVNKND